MKVSEHTQSAFVPSLSSCEPRFVAFATFRLFSGKEKGCASESRAVRRPDR